MKKTLLYFLILGASFFISQNVFAMGIYQIDDSSSIVAPTTGGGPGEIWPLASGGSAADPNAPHELVRSITIKLKNNQGNTCDILMKLVKNNLDDVNSTNFVEVNGSWQTLTFNFTTLIAVDEIYYFKVDQYNGGSHFCSNATDYQWEIAASPGNSYPYADGFVREIGTTSTKDIYFSINGAGGLDNGIMFTSTPSSTCDFEYWPLAVNVKTESTTEALDHWSVGVMSGLADYGYLGIQNQVNYYNWSVLGNIRKPSPLPFAQAYSAYAYICDSISKADCDMSLTSNRNNHLIAMSDTWTFITPEDPNLCPPTSTSPQLYPSFLWPFVTSTGSSVTSTNPTVQCEFFCGGLGLSDTLICGLKTAFCKTILGMFMPNDASVQQFGNLKEFVEKKPPFGYMAIYASTTQSISTSTATTTVNFSEVGNITLVQRLRTGLAWFFYLLFGIWIIKRLSHFSLMG